MAAAESAAMTAFDLHLHRWGDASAPPLLMLHGFPEYGAAWAEVAARLPGWHCVAPDQRGYGQSPAPADVAAYAIKALVGDIVALIERLGAPLPVVAHDWGAAVAYALAIRRPDLGFGPGGDQRRATRARSSANWHAAGRSPRPRPISTFLRDPGAEARLSAGDFAGLRRLFAAKMDMGWLTGPTLDAYLGEWSRPGVLTGMLNWYQATPLRVARPGAPLDIPELPVAAGLVPVPHLVIWAEDDQALLPVCLQGLDAYCPDLTIQRLSGADHWVCHQKPAEVAALIDAFLAARA